ncbi:MAG: OsmC family protein [Candidatus Thorarchaeota archaeon]
MSIELISKVGLKQQKEMVFKCDLGKINMNSLYIDEKNKKEIEKVGPSPVKLLALSILGCLAASFLFCIKKRGLSLANLEGKAETTVARNNKGLWRIKKINISLIPKTNDIIIKKRIEQCKKFFEKYCIISESVRLGIDIDLNIEN